MENTKKHNEAVVERSEYALSEQQLEGVAGGYSKEEIVKNELLKKGCAGAKCPLFATGFSWSACAEYADCTVDKLGGIHAVV
jgi:hypothetical protein